MLVNTYDALMRLPVALLASFFLFKEMELLFELKSPLETITHVATILFLALIALFTLIRLSPVRQAEGLLPRLAALAGFLMLYALLLFERAPLDPALETASLALVLAGNFLCAVALLQLGRSFSVMPEARRLVTRGLYARVRHPLYLAEAIAAAGVVLQYRSAASLALLAAYYGVQLWRMHEEEKVLSAAFAEYAGYRARTARLIPGVY